MKCNMCDKEIKMDKESSGTGYGVIAGKKHCYSCCAKFDKKAMIDDGKHTLYLSNGIVTNWPGSLKFKPYYTKSGLHNIAGTRQDVWFNFNNHVWHGVQYGEMSEICHVRQTKELVQTNHQ